MTKLLFGMIAAAVLGMVIWTIQLHRTEHTVAFSDIKRAVQSMGKKHLVLLVLALAFGCSIFGLNLLNMDRNARVIVTLNFAEASKGQNFNGTHYNMSEIIEEDVLNRAIKDGGFENVTAEDLAECLNVSPLVQGNAYDDTQYHIATEFVVSFQSNQNTKHLDAENVAQIVAQAYKSLYIERFTSTYDVLLLDENVSFEDLEYLDIVEYLSKECSKLKYYMIAMDDENSSFRDSNENSFSGLAQRVDLLKDVQIEQNLKALIVYNRVAKDAKTYVGRLQYDNVLLDYDRQRYAASYAGNNDAITKYDEKMSTVVLVPTWDSDGEFYMGRTKNGTDIFSVDAYEQSMYVAKTQKQISENTDLIAAMNGASSRKAVDVETMVDQIYQTMVQYAKDAWNLVQEYSETQMNQCISISVQKMPVTYMALFSAVMMGGAYVVMVLAVLVWKGFQKKTVKTDKRNKVTLK